MRQEKTLLLNEIREKIDNAKAIVLTCYNKLNPNKAADFRMNIAKSGGSFEVVKKRMLIKAAEQAGFAIDRKYLQGHIGVVFADVDPVQTTKVVYTFRKENQEVMEVIGGRFEGKLCSSTDVELISKLPNQDEMRAQLLGLFEAPMSETLAVVEAILCSVIHCLENKAKEIESSDNP
ncbi:MAG: 50S ribosomal protein L10 [Chlamydiae bacterium]|nr:50S ribosomal protein L10 [Chlamydiota bacterium]